MVKYSVDKSINYVSQIAEIHEKAFPNFFLTSFGLDFLKVFYYGVLKEPESLCVIALDDSKVIGFSIGTINYQNFYKKVFINNFFQIFRVLIFYIIKKPKKIINVFSLFKKKILIDNDICKLPCLLSICVNPEIKSKGIGSNLVDHFEELLKAKRFSSFFLTTDSTNNEKVNNFYVYKYFKLIRIFEQKNNRKMNVYLKIIT